MQQYPVRVYDRGKCEFNTPNHPPTQMTHNHQPHAVPTQIPSIQDIICNLGLPPPSPYHFFYWVVGLAVKWMVVWSMG